MKICITLLTFFLLVPVAVAEDAGSVEDVAIEAHEQAEEVAKDEVSVPNKPGEKIANNFGDALEKSGKEVSKNVPDGKRVANNFGDALEQVGKGVSSVLGGSKQ